MSDKPFKDTAATIWNKRYEEGDLACTKKSPTVDPIDYTQHEFLYKQSIAKRVTGDEEGNPLQMIGEQFLKPHVKKMLAVGSGLGIAEESLVRGGYVEKIIAFEASEVAVESARERIKSAGLQDRIEMRCGDVLNANLPINEFAAVFVQAAIHHFYNIEEMFEFFYSVLKPGGLTVYDEYVGPDHHMYESEVFDIMNEINNSIADENYRWDVLRNETRDEIPQATLEWMLEMDPSEGVHSSKILPLTYKYFDVKFRRDYGGTFMRPFFVGILPNFNFEDKKDQTIANLIILIEELLVRHGIIPNYHSIVVGSKRSTPLQDLTADEQQRINYANWKSLEKFGNLSRPIKVEKFTPANFSDANWERGIGILEKSVLFLSASKRAKSTIVKGKKIIFSNKEEHTILDVEENGGSLIVNVSGNKLDPQTSGYPNKFHIK